jgi:TonB family protein
MRFIQILIIGSLLLGVAPVLTLAAATVEMREAAGPLEQQAKLVTRNAIPKRKSNKSADYPWELRKTGARVALIVQVTVDGSGRVTELRRAQGPLLQKAIGSPSDPAAERAATAAVLSSITNAFNEWRFEDPGGPVTFQLSFSFAGGQANYVPTDPTEILPKEAAPAPWAAAAGAMPTGNIKPPKRTKSVKPVYPKAALDARVKGDVVLEVVIGPNGHVTDARILKSIPQLDQAAMEATLQTEYEPVLVYGNPVSVTQMVTHTFSFKTKAE